MNLQQKFISGITLIEVLIAIAILAVIAALAIMSFSGFRETQQIKNAQEDILSIFNTAKAQTLASKNSSSFGVHIEETALTLFSGDTYVSGAVDNKTINLLGNVVISDINLSDAGVNVVYDRLTGGASTSGTFTLSSTIDPAITYTFTIAKTGIIDISS